MNGATFTEAGFDGNKTAQLFAKGDLRGSLSPGGSRYCRNSPSWPKRGGCPLDASLSLSTTAKSWGVTTALSTSSLQVHAPRNVLLLCAAFAKAGKYDIRVEYPVVYGQGDVELVGVTTLFSYGKQM